MKGTYHGFGEVSRRIFAYSRLPPFSLDWSLDLLHMSLLTVNVPDSLSA